MSDESYLDGKIILRHDSEGSFEELLLMESDECRVHAEMMSDKSLWIGIYPKGEPKRRFVMWISSRGKLNVVAEEE